MPIIFCTDTNVCVRACVRVSVCVWRRYIRVYMYILVRIDGCTYIHTYYCVYNEYMSVEV
jgi:hypothetical protein